MIEFNFAYALSVILFSSFLPGALLSAAVFRKSDFSWLEKALIGAAIGWILQGTLPFLEFIILGVSFSHTLALANSAILYVLAAAALVLSFVKEPFRLPEFQPQQIASDYKKYIIPALVLLLFFLNFWVRVQSLSPIFQELDPYYYLYSTQQVVTLGQNPLDDQTSWYNPHGITPNTVNHRTVPLLTYMEATWYSLYSGSQGYSNYILSLVANLYPPFAAAFACFFIYLGLRAWCREEYALIASAIASFVPIFIMKLMAGEAEIQPYAFFALAMTFAFLLWAHKKQSLLYAALAGLGYFAVSMGSSSEVVAVTAFMLFTVAQSATMFWLKKDLENFLKITGVFLAFPLLAAASKWAFYGSPPVSYTAVAILAGLVVAVLYALQKYKFEEKSFGPDAPSYAIAAIAIAAFMVFAFTPVGGLVKNMAIGSLQIAEFNKPLDRTIAEQGVSGSVFEPQLGFIGKIFDHGIYVYVGYIFAIPSFIANAGFILFSLLLNTLLGTTINFGEKENSVLTGLLFFAMLASVYGLYRMIYKKEDNMAWFFVMLLFPVALIGLLKAKYVIYLGFMVAFTLGFILEELERFLSELFVKSEGGRKNLFYALVLIGAFFAFMQFNESLAPNLLKASTAVRFQDNPALFGEKFTDMCDQLRLQGATETQIAAICAAGKDPVGFANSSVSNQYNQQLCVYSQLKDPSGAGEDVIGPSYRCERITDYWLDSMEWIRYHTENDSRTTSWWDYGHWINFFGQKDAVIRNDHVSTEMIGEIAHDYVSGSPQELAADMKAYGSRYALFDGELILSGSSFGGKYGALNYLACARNNQTSVNRSTGSSMCEFEHLWTQVYIPASPGSSDACQISYETKGAIAYLLKITETPTGIAFEREPRFCLGQALMADGNATAALYDMDSRSADGALKLHKAFLKYDYSTDDKKWNIFTLLYTRDPVWLENGTRTDGWADRTGKFYDSNLYNAFVLGELPGFDFVYETSDGLVKIFKIQG
ncbi:MAG: STT3 domain-containing protein [Candidatus Micrarchaeia archaeon]